MDFFDNHKKLFGTATLLFLALTAFVAIAPALNSQHNNAVLPDAVPLSADARAGKALFISNGCVACHTQQVRNIEMDKVWGERPGIAADYADNHRTDLLRNTATLMGTERTGPDLTSIGVRQPSADWHLVHLFNPRIVVKESIMPAYPWLFTTKAEPSKGEKVINIPAEFMDGAAGKVIASKQAMQLVAYLQSLKQVKLPDGSPEPDFLYKKAEQNKPGNAAGGQDGAVLYATNCQSCHQANGEGLKGAFPPLKGSKIVLDDNPELMVSIIMNGYNGRASEGLAAMPAVGTNNNLSAEAIAAIMNHEKTSWGNNAKPVTAEQVKALMEVAKLSAQK